jgi:hypothetical protein
VEEIERLVGEPVETYTPGTYTAAMVRAVRLADGAVEVRWDPEGALTAARAYVGLTPPELSPTRIHLGGHSDRQPCHFSRSMRSEPGNAPLAI